MNPPRRSLAAISVIEQFLRRTFTQQQVSNALVAVSGGIDSAVVLTLCIRALGLSRVHACFLPLQDQDMSDARLVAAWNKLPVAQQHTLVIDEFADAFAQVRPTATQNQLRLGNAMARARMIVLYDLARELQALVVGTENKSEKYLGYFTRFGDAASDVEPIQHLYKTQVRQIANQLQLPAQVIDKAPSAGLWPNQTDEQELGFSYEQADAVLAALIDQHQPAAQIQLPGVLPAVVQRVADRVKSQAFKLEVPYHIGEA